MKDLSGLDWAVVALVIIGGINWGLVGLFGLDLVAAIFGGVPTLARLIYILVGLAAVYLVFIAPRLSKKEQ